MYGTFFFLPSIETVRVRTSCFKRAVFGQFIDSRQCIQRLPVYRIYLTFSQSYRKSSNFKVNLPLKCTKIVLTCVPVSPADSTLRF